MAKKHGHTTRTTQSPTYGTYRNMLARCHREAHPKYKSYGLKGIFVCDRWRESFSNFLADMGERPPNTTIDRIDGALGYSPTNCRWATIDQQQSNISTNVNIEFKGRTMNVSAWAKELGFDATVVAWRLRNGWPPEQALTVSPSFGNRTRTTGQRLIEYEGEICNISEWARRFGMSVALLRLRLGRGASIHDALTTPKGVFVVKASCE